MRALVRSNGRVAIRSRALPTPAADEVLVQVAVAGVCRTDVAVADGRVAARDPIVLGHEFAGVIVEAAHGFARGQPVAAFPVFACALCDRPERCAHAPMLGIDRDGAFAEYVTVPARNVIAVGPDFSAVRAAYAEPVAAALAVGQVEPRRDERVLVIGANRIGQLTVRVLHAVGVSDVRLAAVDDPLEDSAYDLAVECDPLGIPAACRALRPRGRLVLKSRVCARAELPLAEVVRKELALRAVRYAPFADAVALLARLPIDDLCGPVWPLDEYAAAFAASERTKSFLRPGKSDVWPG